MYRFLKSIQYRRIIKNILPMITFKIILMGSCLKNLLLCTIHIHEVKKLNTNNISEYIFLLKLIVF